MSEGLSAEGSIAKKFISLWFAIGNESFLPVVRTERIVSFGVELRFGRLNLNTLGIGFCAGRDTRGIFRRLGANLCRESLPGLRFRRVDLLGQIEVTGVRGAGQTVSILCRGANSLILDETERSIHDALCVIRCLVKKKALIAGGGAPEIEMSRQLMKEARGLSGTESVCWQAFAEALEVIPTTLAENAGLNSIRVVTELRSRHENGETSAGVSVRRGAVTNITDEKVLQPLLVSTSAIELSAETCKMILRIGELSLLIVMYEHTS